MQRLKNIHFVLFLFIFLTNESLAQTTGNIGGRSETFERVSNKKDEKIRSAGNTVNLISGTVNFPVELISLEGKPGLNLGVTIGYNSTGTERQVNTWNADLPTGILGMGWTLDLPRITVDNKQTGAREDDEFYLVEGGQSLKLIRKGADPLNSLIKTYEIKSASNWKITYNTSFEVWEITKEDGISYLYGGISSGRNTIQWIVKWGNWIGSSSSTQSDNGTQIQQQQAFVWNLSDIKNQSNDYLVFSYDQVKQYVGSTAGKEQTEASYIKSISDMLGRSVNFFYNEKLPDEFQEPHTEKTEPDAYQENYENRYLDRFEVRNSYLKLLNTTQFNYSFLDKGDGTKKLSKRILTSIIEKNQDGDANPATKFEYVTEGVNFGKIKSKTSPSGAKVTYTYSEGISINHSRRDLTISAPYGFSEPEPFYGEDYIAITWRKLNASLGHTNGAQDVKVMVYTWEGEWVEQDLGIVPNVKKVDIDGNHIRQDFSGTQQNDFFAFINPSTVNEYYNIYLFRRNHGSRGKWEREEHDMWTGNFSEKPILRSGDHFVSVHDKRIGWISTFILNDDQWVEKDLGPNEGQGYGEYYSAGGGNYFISHNEDSNPDNINFFFLDEQRQWQRRILPNAALFSSENPSNWYGSNTFALAMAQNNPEYIYQWDENYNNFTKKDILGSFDDYSDVYINNELIGISDPSGGGKVRTARFNGFGWNIPPIEQGSPSDASNPLHAVYGSDLRVLIPLHSIGVGQVFNPNTMQWNSLGVIGSPYIGTNHFYKMYDFYYRNANGLWENKGYLDKVGSYHSFHNNNAVVVYGNNLTTRIIGYPKNGELKTVSFTTNYSQVQFNNLNANMGYHQNFIVCNNAEKLYDANSLTLYRLVDDEVLGTQTDRPVRQIEEFDGEKSYYTSYQYEASTAVKNQTGSTTYYNKVTINPGISLAVLEPSGPVSLNLEKYGYTQSYFFNGLPSSQILVPYVINGSSDRYKYLLGSVYESRVYNAKDTLVSSVKTTWSVNNYPVYNSIEYMGSKQRGLPIKEVSIIDGVESTVNNIYNSIGQLSEVSISNRNSLNQEEQISTTYTYGHQVYSSLLNKNILNPVVKETKIVSGVVTNVGITTWKNWGNNFYEFYKTFLWTGTGNSDFDFGLYGSSGSDPSSSVWKKTSEVLSRDAKGNVTYAADAEGIITASEYDPIFALPVLQVINAGMSNIYANNFDLNPGSGSYTPTSTFLSSNNWIVRNGILKWSQTSQTGFISPLKNLGNDAFIAELQMRIPSGLSNQNWIGFQFNKANASDNTAGSTLILRPNGSLEVQNSGGQVLAAAQVTSNSSLWHNFRIIRRSGTANIYVDGKLLLSNVNTGSATGGFTGIIANNCLGEFDNLRIYPDAGIATSIGYDNSVFRVKSFIDESGIVFSTLYDNWNRIVAKTRGSEGIQSFGYHRSVQNNNGVWNMNDPDMVMQTTIQGKSGIWEDFMTSDNTWSLVQRDNGSTLGKDISPKGGLSFNSTGGGINNLTDSYISILPQSLFGRVCVEMDLRHDGNATDWNLGIGMGGPSWDGSNGGTGLAVFSTFNGGKVWNTFSQDNWMPVGGSFDANRWYRVKIVADINKQKADYYIDGKLLLYDVPFRTSSASISKISLFSFGFGNQNKWDIQNLLVYNDPIHSVEYHSADGKPIQTQTEEPDNQILVSELMYDPVGRETIVSKSTRIPSRLGFRNGFISDFIENRIYGEVSSFNPEDANFPFSKTLYEASPIGRPLSSSLPGSNFNISTLFQSSSIKNSAIVSYGNNIIFPSIGGNYLAGAYFVTKQTSADGIISYTMKDKSGNVLREKSGNRINAYEYDQNGNLVKIYYPNYFTQQSAGSGTTDLTLNQPNTTGEFIATNSISLMAGFSSSNSFYAYLSN